MNYAKRLDFQGKRLLIIDDIPSLLTVLAREFKDAGFEVVTCLAAGRGIQKPEDIDYVFDDEKSFQRMVRTAAYDAVLTDYSLLDQTTGAKVELHGDRVATVISRIKPHVPIVAHSAAFTEHNDFSRINADFKTLGGDSCVRKDDPRFAIDALRSAFAEKSVDRV